MQFTALHINTTKSSFYVGLHRKDLFGKGPKDLEWGPGVVGVAREDPQWMRRHWVNTRVWWQFLSAFIQFFSVPPGSVYGRCSSAALFTKCGCFGKSCFITRCPGLGLDSGWLPASSFCFVFAAGLTLSKDDLFLRLCFPNLKDWVTEPQGSDWLIKLCTGLHPTS